MTGVQVAVSKRLGRRAHLSSVQIDRQMARWARVALEVGAAIGTACRTESIVTGVRRALFYRCFFHFFCNGPIFLLVDVIVQ